VSIVMMPFDEELPTCTCTCTCTFFALFLH
jgi:hypothetical protein